MLSLQLSTGLFALGLFNQVVGQDCGTKCQSFGTDFVDGGSYFQDIASTDDFTAFQAFTGCQNDTAHNILVGPSGDQYECSQTSMQPNGAQQLVTCPIEKAQLTSGDWALVILSNNGECSPIDYMREFHMSVGTATTVTVISTTTSQTTTTPTSSVMATATTTITSHAVPVTTTVTGLASSTFTYTPYPTIVISTKGVFTKTFTSTVTAATVTSSITRTVPCWHAPSHRPDPVNSKFVVQQNFLTGMEAAMTDMKNMAEKMGDAVEDMKDTAEDVFGSMMGGIHFRDAEPQSSPGSGTLKARRAIQDARAEPGVVEVRSTTVVERAAGIEKRHPDTPTVTLSKFATVTSTITAPAIISSITNTIIATTTVTPTVTINTSQTVVTTVTAPQSTITHTIWAPLAFTTITTTTRATDIIVSTTTAGC